MSRIWIAAGSISAFLSVALGAFGAHGLSGRISDKMLANWQTAAHYQMVHALALVALGIWTQVTPQLSTTLPGWCFVAGTLIFSGSLYVMAVTGVRGLGAITPIGGVALLLGWIFFALTALGLIGGASRSF